MATLGFPLLVLPALVALEDRGVVQGECNGLVQLLLLALPEVRDISLLLEDVKDDPMAKEQLEHQHVPVQQETRERV